MKIKMVDNSDISTLNQIYKLRAEVWQPISPAADSLKNSVWTDSYDNHNALHWAMALDDRVLAAARLTIHHALTELPHAEIYKAEHASITPPIASMNRLVIHPSMQGRGLVKTFDTLRIAQARKSQCHSIVTPISELTNPHRINSLLRHGFQKIPCGYQIPHDIVKILTPYLLQLNNG